MYVRCQHSISLNEQLQQVETEKVLISLDNFPSFDIYPPRFPIILRHFVRNNLSYKLSDVIFGKTYTYEVQNEPIWVPITWRKYNLSRVGPLCNYSLHLTGFKYVEFESKLAKDYCVRINSITFAAKTKIFNWIINFVLEPRQKLEMFNGKLKAVLHPLFFRHPFENSQQYSKILPSTNPSVLVYFFKNDTSHILIKTVFTAFYKADKEFRRRYLNRAFSIILIVGQYTHYKITSANKAFQISRNVGILNLSILCALCPGELKSMQINPKSQFKFLYLAKFGFGFTAENSKQIWSVSNRIPFHKNCELTNGK